MWVQHIVPCLDASTFVATEEPVHENCTVIICEAQNEPGVDEGYIAWSMHAPNTGYVLKQDGVPDVVIPTEDRLNPSLEAVDWR